MRNTARSRYRLDWLATGCTTLAVLACYGTTLAVASLSALGVTVALHEGAWAGAISFFALAALASVGLGYRSHCVLGPVVLATAGAAIILWAMFGAYHWLTELAGLVALALAAAWDWRLKKPLEK